MRLTDTGKKKADKYIAPLPIRPYFPLILGASLLFWGGCAACYEACRICIEDLYGQLGILLIILILIAAVFCAATRLLAPSMLILALLVGGFIGVSRAVQVVGATASIQQGDADGALGFGAGRGGFGHLAGSGRVYRPL